MNLNKFVEDKDGTKTFKGAANRVERFKEAVQSTMEEIGKTSEDLTFVIILNEQGHFVPVLILPNDTYVPIIWAVEFKICVHVPKKHSRD